MSDLCKPDLLESWVDATCSSEEAHEMEEHVIHCRTCSNEAAMQRRERRLFDERARHMTIDHAAMWAKVAPRLSDRSILPLRSRAATWVGGAVAAAAALMFFVRFAGTMGTHTTAVSSAAMSPGAALPTVSHEDSGHSDRWSFQVGEKPELVLDNPSGDIHVTTGAAGVVSVHAAFDAVKSSGWKVESKQAKNGVVTTRVWCDGADCGDAPDVDSTAQIPEESALTVHAVDADLRVDQVHGRVQANAVDGDVALNAVREARVKTVNGDINVEGGASVPQKLESVAGDVSWQGRCAHGCALDITTVSGDIMLRHTNDSSYRLRFQTVSGESPVEVSADSDGLPGKPSVVTVRDGQGAISVKSVSGDFSYMEGTPVQVTKIEAHGAGDDLDRVVQEALAGAHGALTDAETQKALEQARMAIGLAKMQLKAAHLDEAARKLQEAGLDKEAAELQRANEALQHLQREKTPKGGK